MQNNTDTLETQNQEKKRCRFLLQRSHLWPLKSLHQSIIAVIQARSLLLVAALWYDPLSSDRHYITSTLLFPVKKKRNIQSTLHWVTVTQQPSLFGGHGYSQRPREATHINASPPPSSLALNNRYQPAAAAAKNISKAALPESAHRQDYLISIELFQMKKKRKKGVSHSLGLFCVPAQCVGSLFYDSDVARVFFFCCFFSAAGCVNLCCCSPPQEETVRKKKKKREVLLSFFSRPGSRRSLTTLFTDICVVLIIC